MAAWISLLTNGRLGCVAPLRICCPAALEVYEAVKQPGSVILSVAKDLCSFSSMIDL
jgi:hypothetical protein